VKTCNLFYQESDGLGGGFWYCQLNCDDNILCKYNHKFNKKIKDKVIKELNKSKIIKLN
jgi:hypothetical protein